MNPWFVVWLFLILVALTGLLAQNVRKRQLDRLVRSDQFQWANIDKRLSGSVTGALDPIEWVGGRYGWHIAQNYYLLIVGDSTRVAAVMCNLWRSQVFIIERSDESIFIVKTSRFLGRLEISCGRLRIRAPRERIDRIVRGLKNHGWVIA